MSETDNRYEETFSEWRDGFNGWFAGAPRHYYDHSRPALDGCDSAQEAMMAENAKLDAAGGGR